jgi:hypothetical protein
MRTVHPRKNSWKLKHTVKEKEKEEKEEERGGE